MYCGCQCCSVGDKPSRVGDGAVCLEGKGEGEEMLGESLTSLCYLLCRVVVIVHNGGTNNEH